VPPALLQVSAALLFVQIVGVLVQNLTIDTHAAADVLRHQRLHRAHVHVPGVAGESAAVAVLAATAKGALETAAPPRQPAVRGVLQLRVNGVRVPASRPAPVVHLLAFRWPSLSKKERNGFSLSSRRVCGQGA